MPRSDQNHPYPSSPNVPPKFNLHFSWPDTNRIMALSFREMYGPKHVVDMMIGGGKVKWLAKDKIQTDMGMIIQSLELEKIMEYEMTEEEAQRVPDEWHMRTYEAFKNKRRDTNTPDDVRYEAKNDQPKAQMLNNDAPTSEHKPKKERVPRLSREGLVTAIEIAHRMEMEPREVRGILRDLEIKKPDAGWAWPESEVAGIIKLVEKGRKDAKK